MNGKHFKQIIAKCSITVVLLKCISVPSLKISYIFERQNQHSLMSISNKILSKQCKRLIWGME